MTTIRQFSFAGGEIAPSIYGRVDQTKYATGLRTCRNFMIGRHGGAYNRPGTDYIAATKSSSAQSRLIPFIFNSDQTYVLEFGNLYIRFYRNAGQITVSSVTAWSAATAYVVGDLASSGGVNYYCILAHTNQTPPNATYWYALTGSIYEIPTPYTTSDLTNLDIQYVQSADVVTIVSKNHAPRELSRTAHTTWVLSTISFTPTMAAPAGLAVSGGAGTADQWVVTSFNSETGEESLPTSAVGSSTVATSSSTRTLSWNASTNATEYNVYKYSNSIYGFIGTAGTDRTFVDDGITADISDTPPTARNPFNSSTDYPGCVTYYQQRRAFGNTSDDPETVWLSRIGLFNNMTVSSPVVQDDDAVTFTLAGRQVNEIRHMIDVGTLVILTSGGEVIAKGDAAGILLPAEINTQTQSYHGSGKLQPIVIGGSVIFQQARGSVLRDLAFSIEEDGYRGTDLTIFSAHLFDGYTITGWAYQQIPHSILWVVRDDGALLGMTYVKDHQVWAWHRHDFENGTVESVCVVPEGDEDALYLVINRTINGSTVRYVERMNTRFIDDIVDSVYLDCAATYDGRNTTASHTMRLTGGTTWESGVEITLTSSASYFVAGDVGNEIHMTDADEDELRLEITVYTSPTVVTVRPQQDVPVSLQDTATADWEKAVDEVTGLSHLEGETVSVFGDGYVVASPNNEAYTTVTVSGGAITLSECYSVIHVGLPITADLETLDIDSPSTGELADKRKLITAVTLFVESSRGIFVGGKPPTDDEDDPLEDLDEAVIREYEGYEEPVDLLTGKVQVQVRSTWNSNGRIFVRQVDPVPLAVLSVAPAGFIPYGG